MSATLRTLTEEELYLIAGGSMGTDLFDPNYGISPPSSYSMFNTYDISYVSHFTSNLSPSFYVSPTVVPQATQTAIFTDSTGAVLTYNSSTDQWQPVQDPMDAIVVTATPYQDNDFGFSTVNYSQLLFNNYYGVDPYLLAAGAYGETAESGDDENVIVVTADAQKVDFFQKMTDAQFQAWQQGLDFITPGDDYMYGDPFDSYGGVTYLVGGAGNDATRSYLEKIETSFEGAGIQNVQIVGDLAATNIFADAASIVFSNGLRPLSEYQRPVGVSVPEGQLNFVGYSWGAVQVAQTSMRFAENGYRVDNVVLIGAPIERDLLNALANHNNIGRVTVLNLTEYGDPIYAGMSDPGIIVSSFTLAAQMGSYSGHFVFADPSLTGDYRRDALGDILYFNGVR